MPSSINKINDVEFWRDLNNKATEKQIPLIVTFELTNRCNLKCRHCYVVPESYKKILSTEEVFSILN